MLSKPSLIVSGGRYADTSTSMASRSRTARAYSARFNRCDGREPGLGWRAAARSMRVSNPSIREAMADGSGRLAPAGGIMPALSFRIIFSVVAA